MASTAGFRHNRLKRRHMEGEVMPSENKRYFSEKIAQEMGVLKLDDHQHTATFPQSIGSPQSPKSSSPPQTFTPPPSPFHITSYQPSSPSLFSAPPSSPAPFSQPSSSPSPFNPSSSAAVFSQRFTPQSFQTQLHQLQQLHHPVNQHQLQQQLQNHQLFQMRQPSSPPVTPIPTVEKTNKPEAKALTLYQPFPFSISKPVPEVVADDEETAVEEEEEDKEGGGGGGFPKFTVNLPAHVKPPESLIPFVPEDLSRAVILYSSPTEVIQNSINKQIAKERRAALEKIDQQKLPPPDAMEDLEPTTTVNNHPPSSLSPFSSPPSSSFPYPAPSSALPSSSSFAYAQPFQASSYPNVFATPQPYSYPPPSYPPSSYPPPFPTSTPSFTSFTPPPPLPVANEDRMVD